MSKLKLGGSAYLDWNTFVVVLGEESKEAVGGRVKEVFPDHHYRMADNCFLISTPSNLSGEVSRKLGINGQDPNSVGAILKLNGSFAGYTDQSLWDWLYQAEERRDSLEPVTP